MPTAGPIIIDLLGLQLTPEERELLQHPAVGGVILFARNYESTTQIQALCQAIRKSRSSPLLITVDQEGGRVQRFKEGFIPLPSLGEIGQLYQQTPEPSLQLAYCSGWLMAAECLAIGVDLSFAPVLDLDKGCNTVIGDRSFGKDPALVSLLAKNIMRGMHEAGMSATGKHFPGHGSVVTDSHIALPIDSRSIDEINQADLQPFAELITAGIDALMPAHIIFPAVDHHPVGFSRIWLQDILRKQLKFSGIIFSDDLNMAGAEWAGNYAARAEAALEAGCDMALICNNRAGAIEILDQLPKKYQLSAEKFKRLTGKFSQNLTALHASARWQQHLNSFMQYRKIYEKNHP